MGATDTLAPLTQFAFEICRDPRTPDTEKLIRAFEGQAAARLLDDFSDAHRLPSVLDRHTLVCVPAPCKCKVETTIPVADRPAGIEYIITKR